MRVTVKLFATFRTGRFKVQPMEFAEGSRVSEILKQLEILPEEVAICLVNGRDANEQTQLHDQDTLSLFPPVGGG